MTTRVNVAFMNYALLIAVIVSSGIALGFGLWGLRKQAVIRRVHRGLLGLSQGHDVVPLQRTSEDVEAILVAFDQLAKQVQEERKSSELQQRGKEMEVVLGRLIGVLRQPLVAVESYSSLLHQAPEIPPSGDTREILQKLHAQVNGLLKLFEASTDVSQLREGISGLERQLAYDESSRPLPVVLLIDEEGEWASHLVELLKEIQIQAIIAPGVDASRILSRVVNPRVLLLNIGDATGLGWRALLALVKTPRSSHPPLLCYRRSQDNRRGSIWTPKDVWLWPLPNNDDSRIVRQGIKASRTLHSLHGDFDLAQDISRWLAEGGIQVEPTEHGAPLVIDGCVTLTMSNSEESGDEEGSYILIIPQHLAAHEIDRLARGTAKASDVNSMPIEELEKRIVEDLARLGVHA